MTTATAAAASKKRPAAASSSPSVVRRRFLWIGLQLVVSFAVFICILSLLRIQSESESSLQTLSVALSSSYPDEQAFVGIPKIAFLFLARSGLHLDFLWHSFFQNADVGNFSIYIHSRPGFVFDSTTTRSGFFYGRQLRSSVQVVWGECSMIEAERMLFSAALDDPANQRFVLVSDSCVPLYNFTYIYNYLMSSSKSFVDSFLDVKEGRYSPNMSPIIPRDKWRKGSQWIALVRKHAQIVVADNVIFPVFRRYCKRRPIPDLKRKRNKMHIVEKEHDCIPDEHYLPTLLSMHGLEDELERRTLTYTFWNHSKSETDKESWHPVTFEYANASPQRISEIKTRNLLRIAIFNISYIRGLFPENYFNDKSVPALEMKIKKLMPMDVESRRLIDWMEKGVYDALQKKYLKALLFCICEEVNGPMIEEYSFSFSYESSNSEEVSMNVSRIGTKKKGATFKSNTTDITPDQMRSSACKMVRTLVQLMRTLDQMPEEHTILMKLFYYEDATPEDYEPPFFRSCTENEAKITWNKNPLKMEVGNVNSKHLVLALKVKSVLDPCEDENDDLPHEEDTELGADSIDEDSSSSDSEIRPSLADHFVVAPAGKRHQDEDNDMISEAETEDLAHEEEQTAQVKEWIKSRHVNTFDLADVLSNFPDISVALTEEIMEHLLKEGLISKAGKDNYIITKEKETNLENGSVKEEVCLKETSRADKVNKETKDYMYMKALYHVLPMEHVTVVKLQSKLDGEASQRTVRKLIEKMQQDGFVKNSVNRRLGRRVVHSEASNRKLLEVKKVLEPKTTDMEMDVDAKPFEFNGLAFPLDGHDMRGGSTCGGLHSIGSDVTRTGGRAETHPDGSLQSGQAAQTKAKEKGNTPISRAEPIASLESVAGKGRGQDRQKTASYGGDDLRSTQDKHSRKASTVKEPILQNQKRQKIETQ